MRASTDLRDAQAQCLAEWVCSPDARAAAHHLLELRRLPLHSTHVDDVLMDTAQRVLRRMHRHGPLDVLDDGRDPVIPYARRTLDRAVTDLLRGPSRREAPLDDLDDADAGDPGPFDLAGTLDAVRRGVQARTDTAAGWAVAAGLVVIALAEDPARRLRRDAPAPESAGEGTRWRWAGLFYGGRHDCFPAAGEDDDVNMRNRRSRALRALDRLLAGAKADAEGEQ